MTIEALHVPNLGAWKFYNTSRIKVASIDKTKAADLGGFDLKAAIEKNPDNLFVKVFAIKANEVNDNGDCFNEDELKKAAHTFVGVPVFVNHQNDNVENARGKVVHSWYDDDLKGIYCINMVDRNAYPRLARGIEEGYITGTSMGAQVGFSLCSICHNKAHTADEFCFVGSTPILMSDLSTKPINQIAVGDEVIDAFGKSTKVTHIFKRNVSEKILLLKSRAIEGEILCTKNHPFMIFSRGEYRFVCADHLTDNHTLYTCKPEFIQDDSLFEKYGLEYFSVEQRSKFARLLGYYGAEGSRIKRDGKIKAFEITFSKDETKYIDDVIDICKSLFDIEPQVYSNTYTKNTTRIRLWNEKVANIIVSLCPGIIHRERSKKYSKDVFSLSNVYIKELLSAFFDGDGFIDNKTKLSCSSASRSLISQIYYMLMMVGVSPSMNCYINKGGPLNRGKESLVYRVSLGNSQVKAISLGGDKSSRVAVMDYEYTKLDNIWTEDGLFAKHSLYSIEDVDFDGEVYNFETESHSYVANNTCVHNCTHIKNGKNRKISGKYECKYHESSCKPEDACPLDGKKKSDSHELVHKEAKVYEWNYDIKFIEDSFVVNPACHDCLVCDILNLDMVKEATSSSKIQELKKVAFALKSAVDKMPEGSMEKTAGKTEVEALTQAMNLMEHVARSMMAQKQQIQMDYVSDLIEQLAKVQSLTDELVEMGYAQLPSPSDQQIALGNMMQAPTSGQSQQVANPAQVGQQQQAPAQSLTQSAPPSSASLGEIGSVTRPTFTGASQELKKDFSKQAENISRKLGLVSSALRGSLVLLAQRRTEVADSEHIAEFSNGNLKITVASIEGDGLVVGKWKNDKLVSWASAEEFGDEIKSLVASNPQEAAKVIFSQYQKELGVNMSAKTNKVASGDTSQQEVTTQKQLEDAGPLHPRENKAPEVVTQAQLDGDGGLSPVNDTTSDNGQLRKNSPPEVVTQAQLEALDGPLARWGDFPEVITQAQWTEMSRRVSSSLGSDYTDQITQAQLQSLQKSHKWTMPETITQDQLNSQKKVSPEGKSDSERWASSAKALVKAASATVADAIAGYGLTPTDVSKALGQMTDSPYAAIKAGYLALVNGSPSKVTARVAERNRSSYFAKFANTSNKIDPVNGLLAAMGDNIGNHKSEDFIDAIKFVVSDKKAFASAENAAQVKIASRTTDTVEVVDKNSMFRQAFAELDRPEDGLYKVCGTLSEDVTVDPSDKVSFMKALNAFAKNHIDVPFVIAKVDLDKEAGVFEAECKDERICSTDEKTAFASVLSQVKTATEKPQPSKVEKIANRSAKRNELVKEAQMMGGQMGGGMGGGGPAGGMGATMPGADMGGMGAPPTENLGGQPGELGEGEDMMGGEDTDMQPKPPGTICPVCGSSDVDVLDGKGKCGNCSAEFAYKVDLEITKYPGLLDAGGEDGADSEEGGLGGEEGGEGFALPEGGDTATDPASIPVAAMTQLRPEMIRKATDDAKANGTKWSLGSISPYTGSTSVMKLSDNKFLCLDTGATYEVHVAGVQNKDKKAIFAEWRFEALPATSNCESCRRKKTAIASALKVHGVEEEVFDSMLLLDKGNTILAMKAKGLLNTTKTASKGASALQRLKKTAAFGSKFPIETCREKIARKFGENALALSGPCEGSNLADCVCKKLSTAGVYSNSIAIKVASVWAEEDGMVSCVEDFVRSKKFNMKQACFICDQLKTKYAQFDDNLADELGGEHGGMGGMGLGDSSESTDAPPAPHGEGSEFGDDVDPFASNEGDVGGPEGGAPALPGEEQEAGLGGDMGGGPGGGLGGTVTIELPLDIIENLDKAIDIAKGENPAAEPHHQTPLSGEAVIELPGAAAEGLDQAADKVLDTAVDATKGLGGIVNDTLNAVDGAMGEPPTGPVDANPVEHSDAPVGGEPGEDGVPSETEVPSPEGESSEEESSTEEPSSDIGGEEKSEETEDSAPDFGNSEESESSEKTHMAQAEQATRAFKKGKIGGTGEINLDLSGVMAVLAKQQGKSVKVAKEVSVQNVQDDKDIGTVSDGSTMGNEEKFDAKKPEVFSGDANMGGEKDAGYDNSKPKASFESGGAEMGDEKAQGYTAEKQNVATGGDKGQGHSASSRARTASLAERIVNATLKTAGGSAKKLENADNIQNDAASEIGKFQANKDNPKSGNPITPKDSADLGKLEAGDSSFMGHEKETLTSVPKEDNAAPEIPVGGGMNPKYDNNDKNAPEKQTAHKGTVIASGDTESSAAKKEAATRVAGRKLKAGMITIDKLASEIEKLSRYESSDLRDLENALFGASKKGLDTVAKGSEKPLIISEKSNQRKIASELKDSLQSLFTLNKKNILASEDPTTEVRKMNYRS